MITIKKIEVPKVALYSPQREHLGYLNEYEFMDARVQIKESQETGYYVMFNGKKVRIDRNGNLSSYPTGMFDQLTNLYMKLI